MNRNIIPRLGNIIKYCSELSLGNKIPNFFNKTVEYFRKFKSCILVFIKDPNLKSVSATLKDYQNKNIIKR